MPNGRSIRTMSTNATGNRLRLRNRGMPVWIASLSTGSLSQARRLVDTNWDA
jgi:hypothetical protein